MTTTANQNYTTVPLATGNSLTDTAAINAAIAQAGAGGVVSFPPNQVYAIRNYAGSYTVIPRLVLGNGSTLKLDPVVSTTLASGTVVVGTTSLAVTDSTVFNVGDSLAVSDGAGNFTFPCIIHAIDLPSNTLTVSAITFAGGATINAGANAVVIRNDNCLYFQWGAQTGSQAIEVSGFVFDGNSANRTVGRQWCNQQLLDFNGSPSYPSQAWAHHNTFQHGPCDAFASNDMAYLKVTDNHFIDIFGNGTHPGGSGASVDVIIAENSFSNVTQATGTSTPTLPNYGHVTGYAAMCTSEGPKRLVIANNVVDGAAGCGFDGLNLTAYHTDFSITGNVFYNCTMGGFRVLTGKQAAIVGNIIENCGHETPYISGGHEVTYIGGGTPADVTISGNVFVESPFFIWNDSSKITVSGNNFTNLVNVAGSVIVAGLYITYSSTGCSKINVTGNNFRGPMTAAELTAVANNPLNGIQFVNGTNINIANNVISGYRLGIFANGGATGLKNVAISGNVLQDQINSGGTNAHGVLSSGSTLLGFSINNNQISRLNDTTATWIGIEHNGPMTKVNNASISNNRITAEVSPASGATGMTFGALSMAGFTINGNEIYLSGGTVGAIGFSGASLTSACWATNNIVHNGSSANYGAATVAAGNQAF